MPKPENTDYPPFYTRYVNQVPDVKLPDFLVSQNDKVKEVLGRLSNDEANYAYAPEKWSIKEVLGHMIDSERVFAYRALCMARGDQQSLPGMEQDDYMANVNFAGRDIKSLIDEFDSVRQATIHFFKHLTDADLQKTGIANNGHFTVNALMYIISGHVQHHLGILEEKYL